MMSFESVSVRLYSLSFLVCLAVGCSKETGDRVETTPVTGVVNVDGQPAAKLQITFHNVAGMDEKHPTTSSAVTGEDGKFAVSTYEENDGVPPGEYIVTFAWGELNAFTRSYEKDKLKGRYATKEKSQTKVKIEEGKPVDMGQIELKTK